VQSGFAFVPTQVEICFLVLDDRAGEATIALEGGLVESRVFVLILGVHVDLLPEQLLEEQRQQGRTAAQHAEWPGPDPVLHTRTVVVHADVILAQLLNDFLQIGFIAVVQKLLCP